MWQRWFAWYPVEITTGSWVWLRTIERRFVPFMDTGRWWYRMVK